VATQCFYCYQCHKKYPTHQTLFDTLYEFSRTSPENCPACGGARELRVSVDFQLGSGDGEFKVVSAFLPDKLESWLGEEEQEVTLYPFLVVLQNGEGKQFCWMPYWHVTGK
jgi:NAD-dependent SIR2 family protein deacetylase